MLQPCTLKVSYINHCDYIFLLQLTAGCSLQPINALSLPQRQVRFPRFFLLTRLNYSSCLIQQACSPLPFPRRWAGRPCLEGPGGLWGRRRGGQTAASPRGLQLRVLHRQRCPGLAGQREERMVHHPMLLPRVCPKLPPPQYSQWGGHNDPAMSLERGRGGRRCAARSIGVFDSQLFSVITDKTLQANDCNKVMLCLSELQGINFSAFQPKDTAGFPNTCI